MKKEGTGIPSGTPIYNALCKQMQQNSVRLHMPGHAGKPVIPAPEFAALTGLDFTEIPGLDDLHIPRGIIAEAQQLLARACGANQSYLLINGTTSGLHALLLSLPASAPVIIPRNAHRSFYGGLVLSGGIPIYLPCEMDTDLGIALAVNPDIAAEAVINHPAAAALFAISPSYFGTVSDISKFAAISRKNEKMLLVDEAHGSHFYFHPQLPDSALSQGASAVVNGLHKTWPAFTQTACLHVGDGYKYKSALKQALDLLTTTSPSYPLMASIDLARDFMETNGFRYLDRALELSAEFRQQATQIKGMKVCDQDLTQHEGVITVDPLKVLIGLPGLSISGEKVNEILRDDYGIQVEMAGERYILAMFSLLHQKEDWQRFYHALHDIADLYQGRPGKKPSIAISQTTRVILSPREAYFSPKRSVPLAESRGKIAGEPVVPYPPGIPCLLPGEEISDEIWNYLQYVKGSQLHLQGPQNPGLHQIMIIDR